MAEIIFRSKQEAQRFYNHLLKYLSLNPDNQNILLLEDRHIVKILDGGISIEMFDWIKTAFYDFITNVKRDDWFREILKEQFYYEDLEEQQQIIEIIYSVFDGQRKDLAVFIKETSIEPDYIMAAIDHIFHDDISFSFDSFLKFRLRPYLQNLESYVEIAIDEYKMEQEYQMFVQMLREFLANREPKMEILHLLFDEEITFYNELFVEIKRGELARMIDRKLLVNHPVYVDSVSIAPLLSLAPTSIYIYTKDPDEPLVRTIKNIFEERVNIKTFAALREQRKWAAEKNSSENQA
ncbi:putative sporulation protein YtxC [Neobacillus vireti]|uniref:Sporulation protein YtxC n=1 Tax=Neobacillus vireti LMG 21834 TaxID=1131730 RepID=A0AB94IN88_9BACI|nr:putative sporulation protein YtxC [Neobacillus vireti]ETI68527.1 Sporulation protein YtxC [Neobacillus vireti LMG 21834]KLT16175.1 sporulation protein [Neobacillus vireti]